MFLHAKHTPRCIASVDKCFDYHTVQLMTSGEVELYYADRRHELRGTWMWPCYPGPRIRFHEWPAGHSWEHRYVAFTGPRVAAWEADGLWPLEPTPVGAEVVDSLSELFDRIIELALGRGRWPLRRATNLLERLLLEWAESVQAASHDRPPWLEAVLRELTTLDRPPNYPRLAASVGMSVTTLRRQFRRATGRTLHHYYLECRVAEARRLLGESDEPLKQIAHRLGYRDVFYFSRQFTQLTGATPATYRRSRQP